MKTQVIKLIDPELLILFSIKDHGKSIYQLAIDLPFAKSTIYYNVRKLQAEGLVVEINGILHLTDKGKELVRELQKMICR